MYQLLRRDFVAALVSKNVPNIDILVSNLAGKPLASLQVKTMSEPRRKWQMKSKHEKIAIDGLFYCFVRPAEAQIGAPSCWIIPSSVVAEHVYPVTELGLPEPLPAGVVVRMAMVGQCISNANLSTDIRKDGWTNI